MGREITRRDFLRLSAITAVNGALVWLATACAPPAPPTVAPKSPSTLPTAALPRAVVTATPSPSNNIETEVPSDEELPRWNDIIDKLKPYGIGLPVGCQLIRLKPNPALGNERGLYIPAKNRESAKIAIIGGDFEFIDVEKKFMNDNHIDANRMRQLIQTGILVEELVHALTPDDTSSLNDTKRKPFFSITIPNFENSKQRKTKAWTRQYYSGTKLDIFTREVSDFGGYTDIGDPVTEEGSKNTEELFTGTIKRMLMKNIYGEDSLEYKFANECSPYLWSAKALKNLFQAASVDLKTICGYKKDKNMPTIVDKLLNGLIEIVKKEPSTQLLNIPLNDANHLYMIEMLKQLARDVANYKQGTGSLFIVNISYILYPNVDLKDTVETGGRYSSNVNAVINALLRES